MSPAPAAVIRQAIRADIPALMKLRASVRENRLVAGRIVADDLVRELEISGRGWVLEEEGKIRGYAIGNARTGFLWALFVDPAHERRGFGRLLLETAVHWLRRQGLDFLWLTTARATRANRLFVASGWQECGETAAGEICYRLACGTSGGAAACHPALQAAPSWQSAVGWNPPRFS